jgi:photosystem II stability/assembly factor-like uncharacterized protein
MKQKVLLFLCILAGIITCMIFTLRKGNDNISITPGELQEPSRSSLAFQHAGWEFLRTHDPETNSIPFNLKAREMDFVSAIPRREEYTGQRDEKSVPDQYRDQSWESLGPDNVCGRILDLGIDISNDNIILAGSASGGLWRSGDQGLTWTKTTPLNAVQSVTCIEQDIRQGKTDTWYYGTGELTSTTDRQFSVFPRTLGFGNGIFKSNDNGLTWELLASTSGGVSGELTEVFQGIWDIKTDASEPGSDIVYVAGYGAIMRSDDGGETWTRVLGDPVYKAFCTDVEVAPDGTVFAALSTFTQDPSGNMPAINGLFRSEDGLTWTDITPEIYPEYTRTIKLELPPADPDLLYVLTETPEPDPDPEFGFSASYHQFLTGTRIRSDSIGWELLTINLPGRGEGNIIKGFLEPKHGYNSIGGYAMVMETHPENAQMVYIGGTNLYRNDTGFIDSTFTHLLGGYPYDTQFDNLHPDIHTLAFSPDDPNILFAGCDGGVYKSEDCSADSVTWVHISNGIISTQFYWVGIDHEAFADDFFIAGCQDNAIYYRDRYFPSAKWSAAMGGDGLTSIVSNNKTYAVISVYNGNIYTLTFDDEFNIDQELYQRPDMAGDGDFIFYTRFVLDPNNNKTLYLAARNNILRKDDMEAAANDSTLLNAGWSWLNNTGLGEDEFITAINISREPANILYYGSHKGKVFRMENALQGNPGAVEITGDAFPVNGFVSCIEIDPYNVDNIFAVFSNYNVASIFHSEDGGSAWTHVSGNLEEYPDGSGAGPSVRWLKMLHYETGTAYFVATSAGLFSTTELNGDQTIWLLEGGNLIGNCIVDNIDARETDGLIAIATQGSGIYASVFEPSGIIAPVGSSRISLLQNFPNPINQFSVFTYQLSLKGWIRLSVYDMHGREIDRIVDQMQEEGQYSVTYNASGLGSGMYYCILTAGNQSDMKKFMVIQ